MNLVAFLEDKLKNGESYRQIEERTKVSRGAIEKIVKSRNSGLPTLETLQGIATGYTLPLWEVIQMAGVDLDLPSETETARLMAYASSSPELWDLLREVLDLPEHQRRQAIRYIQVLIRDLGQGDDTAQA
jgi:transcriptional regulator with XRE-family HTH domain